MEDESSYSFTYKEFAKILQEKGVLQQKQFKNKVVNKYQKIIEVALSRKLIWSWKNGDNAVIKVCIKIHISKSSLYWKNILGRKGKSAKRFHEKF